PCPGAAAGALQFRIEPVLKTCARAAVRAGAAVPAAQHWQGPLARPGSAELPRQPVQGEAGHNAEPQVAVGEHRQGAGAVPDRFQHRDADVRVAGHPQLPGSHLRAVDVRHAGPVIVGGQMTRRLPLPTSIEPFGYNLATKSPETPFSPALANHTSSRIYEGRRKAGARIRTA